MNIDHRKGNSETPLKSDKRPSPGGMDSYIDESKLASSASPLKDTMPRPKSTQKLYKPIKALILGECPGLDREHFTDQARFTAKLYTAEDFPAARHFLNEQYIDLCIVDGESDSALAFKVISHIHRYNMACASLVLSNGCGFEDDEFYFEAGASYVCHYDECDFTTVSHIVRNSVLRATAEYQNQQEKKRLSRHLANMAHDLKNPLGAIQSFSKRLQKRLALAPDSEEKTYFERIDSSTRIINQLVGKLLELGSIATGRTHLDFQQVDAGVIVVDAMAQLQVYAEDHALELVLDHTNMDDQSFVIDADPIRLYQIVSNLISNGLKYTEKGGVTVRVAWCYESEKSIEITIEDSGIGIKKENLSAIFDPYQRINSVIKKEVDGTGLGLAITLELIKLHNGDITVESVVGEGSVFAIRIPETHKTL
jgi:nitrogen-specific signal transduction histidine kinase